jgi:hypothetical protein
MKKQTKTSTGEIVRSFIKHKVYGTVYAIESDGAGTARTSAVVTEATACRHTLATLALTLDVDQVNANIHDFEVFEPVCSDPKHLLVEEIGLQERACRTAESAMVHARGIAKAAKKVFEQEKAKLRTMVGEASKPTPLPLFDTPVSDVTADLAAGCYRDDVGTSPRENPAHHHQN